MLPTSAIGAASSVLSPQGGVVLSNGTTAVTLYLSDLQLEHLGPRSFSQNPLFKRIIPGSDRNVIATQTAAVFTDELLRVVSGSYSGCPIGIEVKGDMANTPARNELTRLEKIIDASGLPVEGYARGNHSSGHAFGVINVGSPWYKRLQRLPLIGRFFFEKEMEDAAGGADNVLSARDTMEAMHRLLHRHREDPIPLEAINMPIHQADYDGYQPISTEERIPFLDQNRAANFNAFWKQTSSPGDAGQAQTRHWECVVNYDIANTPERDSSAVHPIYLQATETVRFHTRDGSEVPVYTISLDGMDNNSLLAIDGTMSEFQVRLVELFMDQMKAENPKAKFKFSSHFSAKSLTSSLFFWRIRRARKAFRRLLGREELILFSFGHTHERGIQDLNKTLKLGRKTPLMEVNVPSLIDYHPVISGRDQQDHDARAIVIEKLRCYEREDGTPLLALGLEFKGLNPAEIEHGEDPAVQEALRSFACRHGYLRARETVRMFRNKHIVGWLHSHFRRLGVLVTQGLNVFRPGKLINYWKNLSVTQYAIDNFTVASTVNMFNEAYHLLPFLESIRKLIGDDEEEGQLAVRAQIESLRLALMQDYVVRRHDFEEALSNGARPADMRKYNDLFQRVHGHRLSKLFSQLRPGSPARAFVILAGIEASKGEYHYNRGKPTKVPNMVAPILIDI